MDGNSERGRGLVLPTRELTLMERRIQSGRRFGAPSTTDTPLGAIISCPQCGEPRELKLTAPNKVGRQLRYWSDCACTLAARARGIAICANATEAIAGTRGDNPQAGEAAAYDVRALAAAGAMTIESFDPGRLSDRYAYDVAVKWLADVEAQQVVTAYRLGPPAAIYLHGQRGRGKTHLAIGLSLVAHAHGRRVAILNERKFWHQLRGVAFGPAYEALAAEPGERAWLTVFDDIGKVRPERGADKQDLQQAWGAVLDRRYNCRRWCIFTSEKTLEELVDQGTIDESIYARVYEMTRGVHLEVAGPDQRLAGP